MVFYFTVARSAGSSATESAGTETDKLIDVGGSFFNGTGPKVTTPTIESLNGTMSNVEARNWYLTQEANIPNLLDRNASLKDQAQGAFSIRNEIRSQARDLMSDREAAAELEKIDPNMS